MIKISAEDSPNVQLGLLERALNLDATHELLVPGVVTYAQYLDRRAHWDKVKQCVGLDAEFYVGAEVLLYPPEWMVRAYQVAEDRRVLKNRRGRALGVDPAEGGDQTATTVVDEYGILEQTSFKTPDTHRIVGDVIAMGNRWKVPPTDWVFDRGGGGKQLADQLRSMGYPVRTVGFGEAPTGQPSRVPETFGSKVDHLEQRQTYKNRRAEMYGDVREWLNPTTLTPPGWERATAERGYDGDGPNRRGTVPTFNGWGIPRELTELAYQMGKVPVRYREGVLYILPKSRSKDRPNDETLTDLIGHSPDEMDSLVLAHHGMTARPDRMVATAI